MNEKRESADTDKMLAARDFSSQDRCQDSLPHTCIHNTAACVFTHTHMKYQSKLIEKDNKPKMKKTTTHHRFSSLITELIIQKRLSFK